jgi:peptide/nickel transport system permease protein
VTAIEITPILTEPRNRRALRYLGPLVRTPRGAIGLTLVVILLLCGLLAPLIAPYNPNGQTSTALLGPSAAHFFGTDELGRDNFSRVLYALRIDFLITVIGVPLGAALGICIGFLSGLGSWIDLVVQRCLDVVLAFPAILLGLMVAAALSPSVKSIIIAVVITSVPIYARLTRLGFLSLRDRDFIAAAKLMVLPERRVLLHHFLPNGVDPVIVQLGISMASAVFLEGSLSFVGLGVQLPQPSLGNMLRAATAYLSTDPIYAVGAMIPLVGLVLGYYLISEALNQSLLRGNDD